MVLSVQVCPYHDRLQKDLNGLTEVVAELREWRSAEEVRNQSMSEKLDRAIRWMQWAVGISITVLLGLGGMVVTLLAGK